MCKALRAGMEETEGRQETVFSAARTSVASPRQQDQKSRRRAYAARRINSGTRQKKGMF